MVNLSQSKTAFYILRNIIYKLLKLMHMPRRDERSTNRSPWRRATSTTIGTKVTFGRILL